MGRVGRMARMEARSSASAAGAPGHPAADDVWGASDSPDRGDLEGLRLSVRTAVKVSAPIFSRLRPIREANSSRKYS